MGDTQELPKVRFSKSSLMRICCGLNLVLVQNFETGSIIIFFCHVFITIIWNNGN